MLLAGGVSLFVVKESFVRHDVHSGLFFFGLLYAIVTLADRDLYRRAPQTVLGAGVLSLLVLFAVSGLSLATAFDPSASARAAATVADRLVDDEERARALERARHSAQATYAIPEEVLAELRGHGVHVDPNDLTPVWAYDLEWNPAPVFHRLSAYTPELDEMNAEHLAADDGPTRILRSTESAGDGRLNLLDAPAMTTEMLCGYAPSVQTDRWQVLARSEARCSEPVALGSLQVHASEPFELPTVDTSTEALMMAIEFDIGIIDRLVTTLYKAQVRTLTVNDVAYRLVPLNVATPGPVIVPDSSGWAPQFRGVVSLGQSITLDHPATVRFSTVQVRPGGSGPR